MRDIPVFTTNYGVASLTLREIPYKKIAYIRLQATQEPKELLHECVSFCRACGAERVYATGHEFLSAYPLHTEIWEMTCGADRMPETDAALFPLQESTLSLWLEHYNSRMADVPNAATMTASDGEKLLKEGSGYFVHKGEILLGIGKAAQDRIDAVVSLVPQGGREVVVALSHGLTEDIIRVEVASENKRAVRLYEKLGFLKTAQIATWFTVFNS